jgi:hypothetical protein
LSTRYSPEINERLLGSLSRAFRATVADIQPVQWYGRAHHVDLLKAVVSAHRDETSAYESLLAYGQLVASDLASGLLQPVIPILTPRLLAKKLPQLWTCEHRDDGMLEIDTAHIDEAKLSLRLKAQDYQHVGVVTLGWVKGLLLSLGCREVMVKQTGWSLSNPTPSELACEVHWS